MTEPNPIGDTIMCVDCGGPCGRLTAAPEFGWQVGDVVAFRCRDCNDVWYLELTQEDVDDR
jgi:hypothetical protein